MNRHGQTDRVIPTYRVSPPPPPISIFVIREHSGIHLFNNVKPDSWDNLVNVIEYQNTKPFLPFSIIKSSSTVKEKGPLVNEGLVLLM